MDPQLQPQDSPSNETTESLVEATTPQEEVQAEKPEPQEVRPDVSALFDADGGDPGDEHVDPTGGGGSSEPDVSGDDFRKAVQTMLWGGPGAEDAARKVLMESGFSPQDADNFVKRAGYGGEAPPKSGSEEQAPQNPEFERALREAEQRATAAEERSRTVRAKQLEQEMDYQLYRSMSDPKVEDFVKKLDDLNPGEDDKSRNDRREVMVQEVRRTALDNLGKRTRKANRFDESWIGEEVEKASGMVLGRYRAALGNVDALGRTSVAVSPEDELLQRKPVKAPDWKPGKQVSDMDTEIKDWTVDVLSRAAMDGGTGESKL